MVKDWQSSVSTCATIGTGWYSLEVGEYDLINKIVPAIFQDVQYFEPRAQCPRIPAPLKRWTLMA
jgi:hypothetical protein